MPCHVFKAFTIGCGAQQLRSVLDYAARRGHRARVDSAALEAIEQYREALDRLGSV